MHHAGHTCTWSTSYSCIDASNEEYPEEEDYTQEEEENFDSYPNKGKLILLQANPKANLFKSKAPLFLLYAQCSYSKFFFTLQALLNFVYQSIFDSWFTWFRYRVVQEYQI